MASTCRARATAQASTAFSAPWARRPRPERCNRALTAAGSRRCERALRPGPRRRGSCERHRHRTQPLEQRCGELLRRVHDAEIAGTEQGGEVARGLLIDGDAERRHALQAGLRERLARVLEAIAPLVAIAVVGLAVGEQQQEAAVRALAPKRGG